MFSFVSHVEKRVNDQWRTLTKIRSSFHLGLTLKGVLGQIKWHDFNYFSLLHRGQLRVRPRPHKPEVILSKPEVILSKPEVNLIWSPFLPSTTTWARKLLIIAIYVIIVRALTLPLAANCKHCDIIVWKPFCVQFNKALLSLSSLVFVSVTSFTCGCLLKSS